MGFFISHTLMKKPQFFSFSLKHLSRLERAGWGILLVMVLGFNIFATQVKALAEQGGQGAAEPVATPVVTSEPVQVAVQEILPVPEARKPRKIYSATLTSYTSRAEETDASPFITANGSHVHVGTVASNCLPFGTKLKVPELFGDQVFVVEDRMNSRYGCGNLDVWFPEYNQAIQFGKRHAQVYVL